MKNVFEQMEESGARDNIELFRVRQSWNYDRKVSHAEKMAREFFEVNRSEGRNCHVSVGGLDSITLHYFLEQIGVGVPVISCSSLEQKGIQAVHRRMKEEMDRDYQEYEHGYGALTQEEIDLIQDPEERDREQKALDDIPPKPEFYFLKPLKSKVEVIRECGWPVLSKEIAQKIMHLQNPTEGNRTVRHAIITGETGAYGGWQTDSRMKLSERWLRHVRLWNPAGEKATPV